MSKDYLKIKGYYDAGLWDKTRVENVVTKNVITPQEYQQITGDIYKD